MRCRMSIHAHSIYLYIYTGHKKLRLYLSAEWCLAPLGGIRVKIGDAVDAVGGAIFEGGLGIVEFGDLQIEDNFRRFVMSDFGEPNDVGAGTIGTGGHAVDVFHGGKVNQRSEEQ